MLLWTFKQGGGEENNEGYSGHFLISSCPLTLTQPLVPKLNGIENNARNSDQLQGQHLYQGENKLASLPKFPSGKSNKFKVYSSLVGSPQGTYQQ